MLDTDHIWWYDYLRENPHFKDCMIFKEFFTLTSIIWKPDNCENSQIISVFFFICCWWAFNRFYIWCHKNKQKGQLLLTKIHFIIFDGCLKKVRLTSVVLFQIQHCVWLMLSQWYTVVSLWSNNCCLLETIRADTGRTILNTSFSLTLLFNGV